MTYDKNTIEFVPIPTRKRFDNLIKRTFSRWTVLGFAGHYNKRPFWWCECLCGAIRKCNGRSLREGKSKSCGCLAIEEFREFTTRYTQTTQSFSKKLKETWNSMRGRCKHDAHYVTRQIRVCDGWQYSFDNFITDMGEPPTLKHSIDRQDNDGHYSCGHCEQCIRNGWTANCRWATNSQQMNNFSKNHYLTFNNKTQTVAQWCRELNLSRVGISSRIRTKKWTDEEILTRPIKQYNYLS